MPHLPLFVPDDVRDPNVKNAYVNVIEHIDSETGRLMKSVRDLGLSKNTYVIFTSDNGPWIQFKHHAGSARPLRSGKGTVFEGGQRVPCVMWAPGRIPAGTTTDAFTTTMDLMPSIAKLAGVDLKPRGPIDGMDITAVMLGGNESPRSEMLFYSARGTLVGLRQGDWKLLSPKKPELYNLAKDIGETQNLAGKMPEKVEALKKRMRDLDTEITQSIRPHGNFSPSQ
jgi:arylsulfatase A-like enzyme